MDINALRTQLQYSCDELRNLTNADLSECKWNTKRTVFLALLGCSNVCRDENDLMLALSEARNKELSDFRVNNASRDSKAEAERNYRTNFYRILLQSLQRIRWPPTLEAFSDPLSDLINDNSLVLSAMLHFLKCGLQKSNTELDDIDAITNRRPKSSGDAGYNSSDINIGSKIKSPIKGVALLKKRVDNVGNSSDSSYLQSSSFSRLLNDNSEIVGGGGGGGSSVASSTSSLGLGLGHLNSSNIAEDMHYNNSSGSNNNNYNNNNDNYNRNNNSGGAFFDNGGYTDRSAGGMSPMETGRSGAASAFDSISSSRRGAGASAATNANLIKIIETLQHQNESLSRQLFRLQKSVITRGEIELKIEAILLDFKTMTEDAAVMSHHGSKTGSVAPGELNSLEREDFEKEVAMEAAKAAGKKSQKEDKTASVVNAGAKLSLTGSIDKRGSGKQLDGNNYSSSTSSNNNKDKDNSESGVKTLDFSGFSNNKSVKPSLHSDFKKLRSQAKILLEQWKTAIQESRVCVEITSPVPSATKDYFKLSPGTHNPNLGSFQGSFQSSGQQKSLSANSSPRFDSRQGEFKRPIDIKTYEVFGLNSIWGVSRPENAFSSSSSGNAEDERNPAGVFDLRKVHSLQKNLVQFSEQVAAVLHEVIEMTASASAASHANTASSSQSSSTSATMLAGLKFGRLEGLLSESQRLSLQLACIAPLSPLTSESSLSSNISGLDALIQEIKTMDKSSKHSNSIKIQKIIDRAKSEEQSLVRAYTKCRDYLLKWPQASQSAVSTLSRISQRFKSMLDKHVVQVQTSCKSLQMMLSAWNDAERDRVPLDQVLNVLSSLITPGASSKHMISPMEKINQGLLGDQLAKFVQTMRISLDDIDQLHTVTDQFGAKIREFSDAENINMRELQAALRHASDQTETALDQGASRGGFETVGSNADSKRSGESGAGGGTGGGVGMGSRGTKLKKSSGTRSSSSKSNVSSNP